MKKTMVYTFEPVLFDRMNGLGDLAGAEVQKTQPPGCPKNGTMRQCYIQHVESGEFIGLVCEGSLTKTGKTAPKRDLAAEARDALSARRRAPSPFQVV